MKIRYLSDLHLEFTRYKPDFLPSVGEDLVVLAGDIAVGVKGIEWAQRAIAGRPVVYVLGNHEFYGRDFNEFILDAKACAQGSDVQLLENDEVFVACAGESLRVLGCTLWTDFDCFGEDQREASQEVAHDIMTDYRSIRRAPGGYIGPSDTRRRSLESRAWLEGALARSSAPTLVVTHHAPTLATMHPGFKGQLSNAAFHSRFDHLIANPVKAWIHGHHHFSGVEWVNGIPVLSNQRGYPGEHTGDFSWDRLFELEWAS